MKLRAQLTIVLLAILGHVLAQEKGILPISSTTANKYQIDQINRKYGMFIHFGINTFHDQEWTDGSKPASSYNPSTIDAKQWVATAKAAGMKHIILVSKHHEGFCLWDSKYTDYDVASSPNKTNVVEEVAKECKKQGMKLGLYYSLWDRKQNADVKDVKADKAYNEYLLKQLAELLSITGKYGHIVELWLDGGWEKENYRWPTQEIYSLVKSKAPECQIGINWSIGLPENVDKHPVLPNDQKDYFPIRYFPSDFRLGDPYLPHNPDPKLFVAQGNVYYMPFETTVVLGERWFFNTTDKKYKSLDELEDIYHKATSQDNILILNVGPNREGRVKEGDVDILMKLKNKLKL
ncbi:calcium:sodium exchange protein [Sphingobacterium cellulitidis]|uniref:alpha-L-fucosidase n=1 Tax=Sphingobacterium cellulitidis TaxID=1768011 RepID=UPI000B940B99|nr:alpha-L-fucosidase [Sphingobacterium cellulitidis]OYD46025.1 calcium:sodium exchange protein [Sphingobacterium cellulitidis]